MKLTPTDLLTSISTELDLSDKPLRLDNKAYRPTVFQVRESKHYVCCFLPVDITPADFIEGMNTQFENYLKGDSTNGYIFFKHEDPELLKESVVAWYKNRQIN